MSSNLQRNANIFLQPSNFNGGTSAQNFNIQGLRVLKGYAYLIPPEYGYSTYSSQTVFINPYDGSPLFLGCGDVILSAVVESYGGQIISDNNSFNIQVFLAGIPTFNSNYNIWEPGKPDTTSISNYTIPVTSLNSGQNIILNGVVNIYGNNGHWPISYNTPLFYNNWINCVINQNGATISNTNPMVKLTLLVLNSFNA